MYNNFINCKNIALQFLFGQSVIRVWIQSEPFIDARQSDEFFS